MTIVSNAFFRARRVTFFFSKTFMSINALLFFIMLTFFIMKKFEKFKKRVRFKFKIAIRNILFK